MHQLTTTDRVCVRGCTRRGEHYAACDDYGVAEGAECRGCVGVDAADGVLVCDRCARMIRQALGDAPDLVAHLRSIADPTKAAVYDRVKVSSSRIDLPAPVAADLIDASNDIMVTLREWALWVEYGAEHRYGARPLEAGIDAATAFDDAIACTDPITADLDRILNHADAARLLGDALLSRSGESSPSWWSVAEALSRWPLEERSHWAVHPCPDCGRKTIRVRPPRHARDAARYRCTTADCGWERDDTDTDGPWAFVFREEVPDRTVTPHDPRWLTLAGAARYTGFTAGTVRRWADKGLMKTDAGRYWRPDLDKIVAEKTPTADEAKGSPKEVTA